MTAPHGKDEILKDNERDWGADELVSVVIPCFNAAKFIADTIESVRCQTYRNLEIIVVDDKSSDDTVRTINVFRLVDSRVRLIELPKNHGAPATPRNVGIQAARGDWIALLDADDIWHPRKLELQMQALNEHGVQMCSTQMKDFSDEREIVFLTPLQQPRIQHISLTQQLLKYRTPTSSIVVRRDLIRRHPFNEDMSYKAREDADCFTRIHEYMPFSIKIAHPLVHYRLQASQISGNKSKMVGKHLAMLKKYRLRSGKSLSLMAYVYTFTHFIGSIYLRFFRRML